MEGREQHSPRGGSSRAGGVALLPYLGANADVSQHPNLTTFVLASCPGSELAMGA